MAGKAGAQDIGGHDEALEDEPLCFRPTVPLRQDFATETAFAAERERFYRQASVYIGCIDGWIEDARRTYMEMYQIEADAYNDERSKVLDELRAVGADH